MDKNDERVISIKDLLFKLMYNWRILILGSLIFAVLLGSYRYIKMYQDINNKDLIESRNIEYQKALSVFNTSKTRTEQDIKNIEDGIKGQREYNENSILMKIDPFNEQLGSVTYYIKSNYKINPDITYQNTDYTKSIVQSYLATELDGDLYNYIQNNLSEKMKIKFIKELITITPDFNTNMLSVRVAHIDDKRCRELFDLVVDYISYKKDQIEEAVGEHELITIDKSFQTTVDMNLDNIQKNNIQAVADLESNLLDKQIELNSLVSPINPNEQNKIVYSTIAKFTILGFIIGVLLISFILLFSYLLSDKISKDTEIRLRYNIRILGNIELGKKKKLFGFIDNQINKLAGNYNFLMDQNEAAKRVVANIKAICEMNNITSGKIIITGSVSFSLISNVYDKVNSLMNDAYVLVPEPNISYSAGIINKINEAKAVVIVEKVGSSSFGEIKKQLDCIADLNKNVLGAILL